MPASHATHSVCQLCPVRRCQRTHRAAMCVTAFGSSQVQITLVNAHTVQLCATASARIATCLNYVPAQPLPLDLHNQVCVCVGGWVRLTKLDACYEDPT